MFNYNPGVNNNAGSLIMQAQQNADQTTMQGVQGMAKGVEQGAQGISQAMQNYGIMKARGESASNQWEMVKQNIPGAITPEDDKRFYGGNLSTKEAMLSTGNTLLQHALTSAQQQQQINAQTDATGRLDIAKANLPHPHTKTSVTGDDGMYIMDNEDGTVTPMMVNGRQVPARKTENDPFGIKEAMRGGGGSQMPPAPQAASQAAPQASTAPVGQGGGSYSASAVAALRANPNLAAQFDAKFGAGSSKAILGH